MDTSSLALAFSAGLVAAVNPCGFALLPAYLSLLVMGGDSPSRLVALRRALSTSAVMTLGFAGVFLLFGLVISPVASAAQRHLPWVTLTLGLLLVGAGCWVLAGRRLPGPAWGVRGPAVRRGFVPVLLYGAAYATASLTCTIAPFLAVVVASFRAGSTGAGLLLFVAYAVGMGALVTTAAVAVALARSSVVVRLRRSGARTTRIAGGLLVVVGGYVAWYAAWELRVLAGATGDDPVVSAAAEVQSRLADLVDGLGAAWLVVPALVVLLVVGVPVLVRRRRRASRALTR